MPDVSFVDIPGHVAVLGEMLLDWSLGHHLLLVGNQGVGKNKLADRLLCLLQCEREYVQLHRDTTVQSLTLAPTLEAGVVVWEDSPLVRAVREGRCLVVDEADKAPLEVVCVLQALVEDGELSLLDGRTIVRPDDPRLLRSQEAGNGAEFVPMAPGFRVIVLANRPGRPFLGNDFYRVCGDLFSCHAIDNPDLESEAALLRSAGPDVPSSRLAQLSVLFADLRDLVEEGRLAYPYSTRELVKLTAHSQHFPEDDLERVCADVFAFDVVDAKTRAQLLEVLKRHSLGTTAASEEVLLGRCRGKQAFKWIEHRNPDAVVAAPELAV